MWWSELSSTLYEFAEFGQSFIYVAVGPHYYGVEIKWKSNRCSSPSSRDTLRRIVKLN